MTANPRVLTFVRSHDRAGGDPYTGVLVDGVPLSQSCVMHSPTGFEFGYGGSGPADLALNILMLFVSDRLAEALHQDFKWTFIAAAQPGQRLDAEVIAAWIRERVGAAEPLEVTREVE